MTSVDECMQTRIMCARLIYLGIDDFGSFKDKCQEKNFLDITYWISPDLVARFLQHIHPTYFFTAGNTVVCSNWNDKNR